MVATQIRLDLNGKKGTDLWARLGESDTRQIVMHPGYYDPEGTWVPLVIDAENIYAKFRIVKPDNTFVIQDASLYLPSDPSIFVVTLPAAATQVAGLGYYDLRIGDGETPDTFLYSAGGRFIVDDDMITDEMIESVASVDGLVFPDDFLTSDALEEALEDYATKEYVDDAIENIDLSDYATKEYVDDAIADIPTGSHTYSTTRQEVGTWIDGRKIYEIVIDNLSATTSGHSYQLWGNYVPVGGNVISAIALNYSNNSTRSVQAMPCSAYKWGNTDGYYSYIELYLGLSWDETINAVILTYIDAA